MRNLRVKLPFFLAIVLAAVVLLTAADAWTTPSTVSGEWYMQQSQTVRGYWLRGYITASWVWGRAVYEAGEIGGYTDEMRYIYRMLMPTSGYTWHELDAAITRHYRENPDSDLAVWQVIHDHATTVQRFEGGDL